MPSDRRDDEFDEGPDDRGPVRRGSNGIAVAALILGLCSMILSVLTGIPAIVCGAIGMTRAKAAGSGFGSSLAGLILGLVGCVMCPLIAIMIGLLLPAVQKVREAASRTKDMNGFKETAVYAHNYADETGTLPAPFYKGKTGDNEKLSWRVALLPYAGNPRHDLSFDYTKPWDAPENRRQSDQRIEMYVSTSDPPGTTDTRVQGFVGPGTVFDPAVKGGVKISAITDGTSNTILFAESQSLVPWAAPRDMIYSPTAPVPPLGLPSRPGYLVCFADGSVRFVKRTANPEVLRSYVTRNDGRVLPPLD